MFELALTVAGVLGLIVGIAALFVAVSSKNALKKSEVDVKQAVMDIQMQVDEVQENLEGYNVVIDELRTRITSLKKDSDTNHDLFERQGKTVDLCKEALTEMRENVKNIQTQLQKQQTTPTDSMERLSPPVTEGDDLPQSPQSLPTSPPTTDNDMDIESLINEYKTVAVSSNFERNKFRNTNRVKPYGLTDPDGSMAVDNYDLSAYAQGVYAASMLLVEFNNNEAVLFPNFGQISRVNRSKFELDGLHKFFDIRWSEDNPKLIKPARVKLSGSTVSELLEKGEVT